MSFAINTPITLVHDIARDLLTTAEQVLLDNDVELPHHRFVSFNSPPDDCCDHLVTHVASIKPARALRRTRASSRSDTGGISLQETDIVLTYIGCYPVGDPIPADDTIEAGALNVHTYAWTLYQGLVCHYGAEALRENFGEGCRLVKVSQLQNYVPIGGCARFTITFTVQLS